LICKRGVGIDVLRSLNAIAKATLLIFIIPKKSNNPLHGEERLGDRGILLRVPYEGEGNLPPLSPSQEQEKGKVKTRRRLSFGARGKREGPSRSTKALGYHSEAGRNAIARVRARGRACSGVLRIREREKESLIPFRIQKKERDEDDLSLRFPEREVDAAPSKRKRKERSPSFT